MSAIGRRYAKALLDLAVEHKIEDKLGSELDDLAHAWENSAPLRGVFQNPNVDAASRTKVIDALAARMTLTPTARNAMRLLADRRRLPHLRAIGRAYHALREERGGLVLAEVTTASALPDAYFAELERTLGQVTGRKVRLVKRVDPSLIAGVVTKVGDKVFDGSMKNRLSELRASLSDAT